MNQPDPFSPSSDPFASPIDPSVPLAPPAAADSPFMRIACLYCSDGRLRVSTPDTADPTHVLDPFIELSFEYAVAVQPPRGDAPGYLTVSMRCKNCSCLYRLTVHEDGRMELQPRDA